MYRVPRVLLGGLLLCGLLCASGPESDVARAGFQNPQQAPVPVSVSTPVNRTVSLQVPRRSGKDPEPYPDIDSFTLEDPNKVLEVVQPPDPRDPKAKNKKLLVITSKGIGKALLRLTVSHYNDAGAKDDQPTIYDYQIEVTADDRVLEPRLEVSLKGTIKHQMQRRGDRSPPIGKVRMERQEVVKITPSLDDPVRAVDIEGSKTGRVRIYLYAEGEDFYETYEVSVVEGIDFLRTLIRENFPTAVVEPKPGPRNTIILTGWVAHATDIEPILQLTRSFSGLTGAAGIVNALKVGGVQQVQLDVVVARVARSEFRRMAIDLYQLGQQHQFTNVVGGSINVPTALTLSGGAINITNTIGSPNGAAFNSFLAIFTQDQTFFWFLQALRDNNLAKLLAEPRLVTMSGKPARFVSGGQQAVPQVSGIGGTAGVQFVDFGTAVNFLPIVMGNGKIFMEVEPAISALDAASGVSIGGALVPGRLLQQIRTSVEMEPGQTLVIGGLIQNTVAASSTKVPVLGDLPFIGTFFSRKSYNEIEEEVLIMVTPHLVDPLDCCQLPKFVPGQETRRPADVEFFLEGLLEAPRGQRDLCPDRHYVPAYKLSPTFGRYPCGLRGCGSGNGCGATGCGNGCSTNGTPAAATPPATTGAKQPRPLPRDGVVPVSVPE